jgi:hypothetical protein
MKQQAMAQAMYMEFLAAKAKKKAVENIEKLCFDPQERILIDVSLEESEMALILNKINLKADPEFASLEEALGRKPTPVTTVSLDVQADVSLKPEFDIKLQPALREIQVSDENIKKIQEKLQAIPKGSIIALNQEFHFHLSLACRVYKDVAPVKFFGKEEELKTAHQEAMFEVNKLIMKAYAEALKSAISQDGHYLDIAKINKRLDKARKEITQQAHTILMQKIIENTGVILSSSELKKTVDKTSIKHVAENRTATANDVLHTDVKLGLATWIAGSENTAHARSEGARFGDRQIVTHLINDSGDISAQKKQRLQIRTPSPVVRSGLKDDQAYFSDVVTKFSYIKEHYDLKNRASGDNDDIPKAFIYNRYTAINHTLGDIGGNLQSQSAFHILHGAHQYNKVQADSDDPVFCFVQSISVNGFGDTLGYSPQFVGQSASAVALKVESTLMTEMALLHTLYETASEEEKVTITGVFQAYTDFLTELEPGQQFFSNSIQGKAVKATIDKLKDDWKHAPSLVDGQDVATLGLKNLMAHNLHFTHEYSKLFQALSVYVEQVSIGGCKSGNERAQAINGRVAILDSVFSRQQLTQDEIQIQDALYELAEGGNTLNSAQNLKKALDKYYNKVGLQTGPSIISLVDQGASAKVEAKPDVMTTSTNQAEERASVMTNLQQSKAGSMQAHKNLTKNMVDALQGHTVSWWSRMTSGALGGVGAAFKLLVFPIAIGVAVYTYYDNKRILNKVKGLQEEAQKQFKTKPQKPAEVFKLTDQISTYRNEIQDNRDFVTERVQSDDTREKLYRGITEYDKQHAKKVSYYETKYSIIRTEVDDPMYFRKALVAFIETHAKADLRTFKEDSGVDRATNPEKANITLKKFLGKQGAELYKLALEEEMHSKEYREAVFRESTTHYDGEKWKERPVVIVAGPSGCGKSFAAESAVKKASEEFLAKDPDIRDGNDVISVDGGIVREVSQMRKLLTQAVTNKGFTGVRDLHKQSKVLGKVKDIIQEVALATPTLGVVIPETFSNWVNPRDDVSSLMSRIDKITGTKLIFTRVKGDDPKKFPEVVAFMGSRRAWKTNNFESEPFDLNKKGVAESKAYGAGGFKPGKFGSKQAEKWYISKSKDKNSMIILNDLILLKKDPAREEWGPALPGDEGAGLFSKRIYDAWCALPKEPEPPGLKKYSKDNSKPIIYTSKIPDVIKQINEQLSELQELDMIINHTIAQFEWIAEMEVSVHVYNLALQGQVKFDAPTMIEKYKELSKQCDMIVEQLKVNQQKLLEALIKIPEDVNKKEKADVSKLLQRLENELMKIQKAIAVYEKAQQNLSGEKGILAAIADAKEGGKNFHYKTEQMACTVCPRDKIPGLDTTTIPKSKTVSTHEKPGTIRNFMYNEIPEDQLVVYDVQHTTTKESTTETVTSLGRFTEELVHKDGDFGQVDASKARFEIVQFPKEMLASASPLNKLIEDKVNFVMAMAIQILASMDTAPTKKNPIHLTGDNREEMRYLWTALLVLGENNPKMKFGMDAISVNSSTFSPESEKGTVRKFKSDSLYYQVFKNPEFQAPVKQKIIDLQSIFNAKHSQAAIQQKVEATVSKTASMLKHDFRSMKDAGKGDVVKYDEFRTEEDHDDESEGERPSGI